jgi:hypothetical protein
LWWKDFSLILSTVILKTVLIILMVTLSNKAKLNREYILSMREAFLISNRSKSTLTKVEFSLPELSLIVSKCLFLMIEESKLKINFYQSWMKSRDFWCIKSKNTVIVWALKKLLIKLVAKISLIWCKLNKLIEIYWLFIITRKRWARFYKIFRIYLWIKLKRSWRKYSKKIK